MRRDLNCARTIRGTGGRNETRMTSIWPARRGVLARRCRFPRRSFPIRLSDWASSVRWRRGRGCVRRRRSRTFNGSGQREFLSEMRRKRRRVGDQSVSRCGRRADSAVAVGAGDAEESPVGAAGAAVASVSTNFWSVVDCGVCAVGLAALGLDSDGAAFRQPVTVTLS